MKLTRTTHRAMLLGSTVIAGLAFASPASAQQQAAAAEIDEIVVTGTRIARPELVANSPIQVFTYEAMKLSGTTNVEEYLRHIPQAVQAIGGNTNNGNPGVATIDLRNLSEERTLVLVEGKRFIPYDSNGIVDLSMIPPSLIERVEIVTGGASAVYGSDAIAGVVNFIMRKDFEGAEFDAQYGLTSRGDSNRIDFSSTVGGNFANGKGNIVLNASYTDQKPVYQGDRAYSNFSLASANFGAGGSRTDAPGAVLLSGGFFAFDATTGNLVTPQAGRFNFNPFNLLQSPQEKWTATAIGHYDITDDIEFFSRLSLANSRVSTIIAPTGTFFFPYTINYATNPFLNAQARGVLAGEDTAAAGDATPGDGNVTVALGRRLVELGTRDSVYDNTAYQVVGGFRGTLGDYNWETFAQYGRTQRVQNFLNDFNYTKSQQALLSVAGPGGTPVCTDTSNNCAPFNPFGGPGSISQAAADFIRLNLQENGTTSQFVTGGTISGDLPFTLPAATSAAAFAVGIEYRRESSSSRPDDNYAAGNAPGFGSSTPIDATYDVFEAYGEALVPIIENREFAKSVSLDLGVRGSWYKNQVGAISNKFNNVTYKIGGSWAPTDDARLRGLYQRAVRAPNINELAQPRTPSTGDANLDYCAGANPVGNAALTALCIATGVPAARIGSVAGPIAGQINNYVGGNPLLTPEKADTYTIGAVFTPTMVPRLELSFDYYDVKVKNAIVSITEQSILDACYTVELNATAPFCSRIFRNPLNGALIGGTETGVDARSANAAVYLARGLDFTARYSFGIGDMGTILLDFTGNRVFKSIQQDATFLPANNCAGIVGEICLRPNPKWRWTQTVSWDWNDLTLQARWNYFGKVTHDSIALGGAAPTTKAAPVIGSQNYFDLTGLYDVTENITVRAGITNLFDNKPPVVGNDYGGTTENSGNTYPATYEPLGTAFFFGATLRF